ncbi:MAG: hypothetical protein HYR60_22405 [Acidobacteria bacterium]|nr:hypothetical protein [Acidobacteriota bacterium]
MTTQQLYMFNGIYLIILTVVAILTRATLRRMVGAIAGAAGAGVIGMGMVALWESVGWWHMVIPREPYFLALLWINVTLCAYVFLLTWRIARRFGGRGLALAALIAAAIGPFRDSWYMAMFPEWGSYAPGIAPMLAISVTYLVLGIVGHSLMRLVAGPAEADRLARRPWERTVTPG